jgi:aminoglycoside/choline kinase family phosphotransferase
LFNQHYPNQRSKLNSENWFTTWRKLIPRIQDQENSPAHRSAFLAWKELERGLNKGGLIDDHLQQHIAKAAKK